MFRGAAGQESNAAGNVFHDQGFLVSREEILHLSSPLQVFQVPNKWVCLGHLYPTNKTTLNYWFFLPVSTSIEILLTILQMLSHICNTEEQKRESMQPSLG